MATASPLLDDDGAASMASMFLMAHHGLRRDLTRFARAIGVRDPAAMREEWQRYHLALHGHHMMEDTRIFPQMRTAHPGLAPVLDRLDADHQRIAPLLERGDRAFAGLPATQTDAADLVAQLQALLTDHLDTEEAHIVQHLRGVRQFPVPGTEAELKQYANGLAWCLDGIPQDAVDQVHAVLPQAAVARLPAARAAYAERCRRVWG